MAAQAQQQQERAAAYARHVQQRQAVLGLEARRQTEYEQRQGAREEAKLKQGSGGGSMQGQPARQAQPPPVTFLKKDFPSLGGEDAAAAAGTAGTAGADPSDKADAGDEPLLSVPVPGADQGQGQGRGPVPPPTAPVQSAPTTRLLFNNPTPGAPPISANHVRSYFFTPRDLCYVVHSMMRPLITLDAYNGDYYRWGYDDRRSRNLLSLGGNTPTGNNLPNPVWKETKAKAQHIEDKYRGNVEKRADKWSTKQQTLGRTVKVNVKRPKALLATTGAALTMGAATNANDQDEQRQDRSDEDRARISLWSARMAIDRGYRAYLDLLETRRLLQTRGGGLETESEADRRAELTRDVEGNVAALHGSLGIPIAVSSGGGHGEDGG